MYNNKTLLIKAGIYRVLAVTLTIIFNTFIIDSKKKAVMFALILESIQTIFYFVYDKVWLRGNFKL